MAYHLRSRDAAALGVSGDETPAVSSVAIVDPSAAEALRASSAAAEMGIIPEMSERRPLLGSLSEFQSATELVGPSQSVFASRLGLAPAYTVGEIATVSATPLDPGVGQRPPSAAGALPTPAAELTLSLAPNNPVTYQIPLFYWRLQPQCEPS